jgi:hypothetical protein
MMAFVENKTAPRKATMKPVKLPEFCDRIANESYEGMNETVSGYWSQ